MKNNICTVVGTTGEAGLQLAREYAADGYKMAVIGLNRKQLDRYRAELEREGAKVETYHQNYMEGDHFSVMAELFRQIRKEKGSIRALIYNESIYSDSFAGPNTEQNPYHDIRLNCSAAYAVISQAVPHMKKNRHGAIHFTGPEFNQSYRHGQVDAACSMARELCFGLNMELAPMGIRVWEMSQNGPQPVYRDQNYGWNQRQMGYDSNNRNGFNRAWQNGQRDYYGQNNWNTNGTYDRSNYGYNAGNYPYGEQVYYGGNYGNSYGYPANNNTTYPNGYQGQYDNQNYSQPYNNGAWQQRWNWQDNYSPWSMSYQGYQPGPNPMNWSQPWNSTTGNQGYWNTFSNSFNNPYQNWSPMGWDWQSGSRYNNSDFYGSSWGNPISNKQAGRGGTQPWSGQFDFTSSPSYRQWGDNGPWSNRPAFFYDVFNGQSNGFAPYGTGTNNGGNDYRGSDDWNRERSRNRMSENRNREGFGSVYQSTNGVAEPTYSS